MSLQRPMLRPMHTSAHFTPWRTAPRPCWHCAHFEAMTRDGSAALCRRATCSRVRSMPDAGCSAWEREVGADDEPDQRPYRSE